MWNPPEPTAPLRPRLRFSLTAKIVLWCGLNLLFLALVGWIVVRVQFRFGLDSFLGGRAGERLQAMSEVVAAEFRERPRNQWAPILARYAKAHQVQVGVFNRDAMFVSGEIAAPPQEVVSRMRRFPGPPPPGLRAAARENERFPRHRLNRPHPPEGAEPLRGRGPEDQEFRPPHPFPPPATREARPGFSKFILHAGEPKLYWIGIHLPVSETADRPPHPMTLLIASPSLSSGGLLFELTPWIAIGAGVLLGSGLFWFPLVRGITRSLQEMNRAAGAIAQGRFETGVDTSRSDELGQLGASLNHMAGRLKEFVSGQKRFLGDIAHELCSPLARMELALGVLDQRADEKQRAYIEDVREEVRHMSRLLDELLSFTKAGMRAEIALKPLALEGLVQEAVVRENPGAAQPIEITLESPALTVLADAELLGRAISNVIRNALRYAGHAGPITLTGARREEWVILTIRDHGPGVPEATLHRLFDPFFRPEAARTRETGGTGLGLAIVKSCVEACDGTVGVRNASPSGLEVEFKLRAR